jgi:hypothetical protein
VVSDLNADEHANSPHIFDRELLALSKLAKQMMELLDEDAVISTLEHWTLTTPDHHDQNSAMGVPAVTF